MKQSYLFPVTLIITGILLLVNQFELIEFTRPNMIIGGSTIIGLVLLRKAFLTPARNGLFGALFFIILAIEFLMLNLGYLPMDDYLIVPIILFPLGMANLVFYLFTRKNFTNITFGLIFLIATSPFLLSHYGYISYWEISNTVSTYWPVLLITAGLGFLIEGIFKKAK